MSEKNEDQQDQQNQQNDNNKEAKKFEANFKKVIALFSGEAIFKKAKIGGEQLNEVIAKLVKVEKEAVEKALEEKLAKIVSNKRAFDKFCKDEQAKVDSAILAKKKEMNKEMNDTFALVDKIENIEREYYQTLSQVAAEGAADNSTNNTVAGTEESQQQS